MPEAYMVSAKAQVDQIHPMHDIILVRRIADEEATAGGLIIPAIARDPRTGVRIGEVLRVGYGDRHPTARPLSQAEKRHEALVRHAVGYIDDLNRIPMECKRGDRVLYMRCPDNDVCVDGVDCVLLREEQHILAILVAVIDINHHVANGDCK